VIAAARPPLSGERFRRATRECLLGVAAVEALLREANIERRGDPRLRDGAGLRDGGRIRRGESRVYCRGRREEGCWSGGREHEYSVGWPEKGTRRRRCFKHLAFPVYGTVGGAAEVAIEFGLNRPVCDPARGAAATIDGLWQATLQVGRGRCRRALVLASRPSRSARALARGRWLLRPPLVESAACALLIPGPSRRDLRAGLDGVTPRGARARSGGRDAGLRAVDRVGAGARGRRRGPVQAHGPVARAPRGPRVGGALGARWIPRKSSTS